MPKCRQYSWSISLAIVFSLILFSISPTTFSQNKKYQQTKHEQIDIRRDSSQKEHLELNKKDSPEIQKIIDTTNPKLKVDTINEQLLKTENEIQKQLQLGFDSLKSLVSKKDTAFNLRVDTLINQTKPEGFWKGFVKDGIYTWLYDTITNLFSSKEDASGSIGFRWFTFLSIIARVILSLVKPRQNNDKPKILRLTISIALWLSLIYSFSSYSQNKDEEQLENIKKELKQTEQEVNKQMNTASFTNSQINSLLQAIDKINLSQQQLPEYQKLEFQLKTQSEILANSQKEMETKIKKMETRILELKQIQIETETNIINKVKDYSTHGFWIFFLIIIIIFSKEIRELIEKIYDSFKGS